MRSDGRSKRRLRQQGTRRYILRSMSHGILSEQSVGVYASKSSAGGMDACLERGRS